MSHSALTGAALTQRFAELDQWLVQHQALWRPRPFTETTLGWESCYPQLAAWLREQSLEHAENAQSQPWSARAPAPFPTLAEQAQHLSRIPALAQRTARKTPTARFSRDIPGRKLEQIQAFSGSLNFSKATQHWLDWCSGKGHLGRWLALEGQALTCLEYDPALVDAGRLISQRCAIDAKHIEQDVLAENCLEHLHSQHTPVALHACGDLHVQLLKLASQQGCQQLAIAPCCYNRISGQDYQPLSQTAIASALRLNRDDLALPLNEAVTAPARLRKRRDQSMAWRLAFDHLQRQIRGVDQYLPTPSLPPSWLEKPFARFCQDLAELRQLPQPPEQNWSQLEQHGWQRLAQVRNLELVRQLFRRPLELWLVLDRAIYLQEQGYNVSIGTFCHYDLSPRNLLLLAER